MNDAPPSAEPAGALRAALDLEHLSEDEHGPAVEGLRSIHQHTITFIEADLYSTCAPHAFGFRGDPGYNKIAGWGLRRVFAGENFVEWLLENKLKRMDRSPPSEGLVFYYNKGKWKHVGVRLRNGRVISKWGTFPVYEHNLMEVPANYGDTIEYYEILDRETAFAAFLEYAKACKVPTDVIEEARDAHQSDNV